MSIIAAGAEAPDFELDSHLDSKVKLSDYRGKKSVMLVFYPLDFTFVCPTEILAFSGAAEKFAEANAQVVGVSIDSHFTHLAWINTPRNEGGLGELNIPLVSDINKTIARDYGVLIEAGGVALRGLFLIDPKGTLRYQVVHDLGVGRSVNETLRVLKAFQHNDETGNVCPAGWDEGADDMKPDVVGSKEYFNKTHG